MAIKLYEIECITNLQVGTGETNLDIVDIRVEKDRNVPCIYASSLKGALRENYEKTKGSANSLFGDKDNDGKLKFLQAFLVSMPMRVSQGRSNYKNVCNATTIKRINKNCELLGIDKVYEDVEEPVDNKILGEEGVWIEGIECYGKPLENGDYVIGDDLFKYIPLPIQIRNRLDKNKNLWYEEYVPYGSKFVFAVIGEQKDIDELEASFGSYVQIGGNSSLGFGLCKIVAKN